MNSLEELWISVPYSGYPYEVSNLGRIRRLSVASEAVRKIHPNRNYSPRIVNPTVNKGYHYVTLSARGMRPRRDSVHAIVLTAFCGPRQPGMYGCHGDGNKANNQIGNLRWDTPKSNQVDRVIHGHDQNGENNGSSKLTSSQVVEILKLRASTGMAYRRIAERFSCTTGLVHLICTGKIWKHIDRRLIS